MKSVTFFVITTIVANVLAAAHSYNQHGIEPANVALAVMAVLQAISLSVDQK